MDNFIGIEQTAYIKGRFIGNFRVYEYCKGHNSDGVLMFLDSEKALIR